MENKIGASPADAKPSEVTDVYWIYAERKKGDYPAPTPRSGKWLIFLDNRDVDEAWAKIKKAAEDGKLGGGARVATSKPSPLGKPSKRCICVYTYDWTDKEDVKRVREELRKLSITNKIPYKSDEDTPEVPGHVKISEYYE